MDIFLSYSSAQRDIAERLALSLRGQGHSVFYDRSEIEAGSDYESLIREAIDNCDLFVFLISPESVASGSYPLAEIGLAEKKWSVPAGRILPILVKPVPMDKIPSFLRAVSILDPRGDFVAEASAAVAAIAKKSSRKPNWLTIGIGVAILAAIVVGWFGYAQVVKGRERDQQALRIIETADLQLKAGSYEAAFNTLGAGTQDFPEYSNIQRSRTAAAELWLRNIRVRVGERTFADVVKIVQPVLINAAANATGQEAGDILAHLGWCEYLLAREDQDGDPATYFERSLQADPSNPYGHAMWGFWILFKHGKLADAGDHFASAVASKREVSWARQLQLAGLMLYPDDARETEAIHVVEMMRGENLTVSDPDRLWPTYQSNLLYERGDEFLKRLSAGMRAATFQWLFPIGSVAESRIPVYHLILGRLLESDGENTEALTEYRWVENHMREAHATGSLLDRALEGIRRLNSKPSFQ